MIITHEIIKLKLIILLHAFIVLRLINQEELQLFIFVYLFYDELEITYQSNFFFYVKILNQPNFMSLLINY